MSFLSLFLARTALVLTPIALGFACAEWYASTTPEGNAAYFVEDPELAIVRKPGMDGFTMGNGRWIAVHINENGLRGDELPAMRDPGESWVLCIGDSFTFGGGVETNEAWPQQLQSIVGAPQSSKVRILNGGANGWDTPWQRTYLEKRGLPVLKPAIVVLGFNWNDLEIELDAPKHAVENFIICKGMPVLEWFSGFASLRGTHLYRLAYNKLRNSGYIPTDAIKQTWIAQYRAKRNRESIEPERRIAQVRSRRYGSARPDDSFWVSTDTPNWRLVRDEIVRMRDLCSAAGVKFMVAILPEPTWTGPGLYPGVERMAALLDSTRIPYVDIEPEFLLRDKDGRWNGQGEGLWLNNDPFHPTAKGQKIFATVIAAKLRELNWIPPLTSR